MPVALAQSGEELVIGDQSNDVVSGETMADSVFELQDVYDLEFASDRRSRLSAYLAQNARRFRDWDGALTGSPVEFAAAAFVLATVPVMSPPYVSTHPRVLYAAARFDEDGRCGLVLELAAPMATTVADQLPLQVNGWGRDPGSGRFFPPEDNDHLAVYSRLTARIPFPVDALPEPVYTDTGIADMETVKDALRVLTNHANSVLGPVIATLDNDSDSTGGVEQRARRDRYVTGSGLPDRAQGRQPGRMAERSLGDGDG